MSRALPNHDFFLFKVRPLSRLPCNASWAGEGETAPPRSSCEGVVVSRRRDIVLVAVRMICGTGAMGYVCMVFAGLLRKSERKQSRELLWMDKRHGRRGNRNVE